MVLDRYDLARKPLQTRRLCRHGGVENVLVHSVDWKRERVPQLYPLVLLISGCERVWFADDRAGTMSRLPWRRFLADATAILPQLLSAAVRGLIEIGRARALRPRPRLSAAHESPLVFAIWTTDLGVSVGGAVTHMSGILKGFREHGWRVALVTRTAPAPQLADLLDVIAIADAPPPGARLTPEIEELVANASLRAAATELRSKLGTPGIIYQRHAPFRVAGIELARAWRVPLVLEWNSSAAWTFNNWADGPRPFRSLTSRLIRTLEQTTVRCADSVVAVSDRAAETAVAAGATRSRVFAIPNGVDIDAADAALVKGARTSRSAPTVGWVGTFGPWHGAEILIRAMSALPPEVEALMIGDGRGRSECERLAIDLQVSGRVNWTGRVPHDEALGLLGGCDVLASPHVPLSAGEPFFGSPTKLFEYMALGRPIVASRLEQIGQILEDGRTALLVDPGDPSALAHGIMRLLGDRRLSLALAASARKEAEVRHSWNHRAADILAAASS